MISLVLLVGLFGCTLGQYRPDVPLSREATARIVGQSQDGPNPDGSYAWGYETENGISARENGLPKAADTLEAQGEFKYTAQDGTPIQLVYVANENGFQPQGAHLPTPPPIPEEILRSIEYNAQHPEEDESQVTPVVGGYRQRIK
ncbi:endocuticle structural glycoprotein SgAbd-2-like [Diorhabda carinulata]|uniref:endocuticle structural glycoprotein SgAbd-2-like n=1 Tax=Diorhabda sublineata TaxID=1163346 RepID=UPI0024E0BB06|nr:endocuticle structural glycoprotein SgAbd-2-like [Diorhabda sublineata]XP_057666407.1 endocuticle structural glycoprotein SgAbd-2-like [Diorhabda carinulata]